MSPWRDLVLLSIWGDTRIQIVKSVPKNLPLSKGLSHQIPWSAEGLPPRWTPSGVTSCSAWGSVSVEADGKCFCCPVIGSALGKCQFLADNVNNNSSRLKCLQEGRRWYKWVGWARGPADIGEEEALASLKGLLHHCPMEGQPALLQIRSLSTAVRTLNFVRSLISKCWSTIWNLSKQCAGQTTYLIT